MKYIVIENQGEAEALGMRLMGASSKDPGQIGRFGTGWKYGIAGVVRLGGPFEIQSGIEVLLVDSFPVSLRGQEHREVTINGAGIGVTDQLGKDWEPWMVLREFISNAIDEGGHRVYLIDDQVDDVPPESGKTKVIVPYGPFADVFGHLDDYFCLTEVEGEIKTPQGRAIPKRDKNIVRFFKKGVLVKKETANSIFDYELADLPLGEDRIAGDVRASLWAFLNKAPVDLKQLVVKSRFEAGCYNYQEPDPSWKQVFGDKLIVHRTVEAPDEMIVPHNMLELAERLGCRTLKSDLAAKAAQRETMPATYTVREVCKKLAKIGLDVNPAIILMSKLEEGEQFQVDGGLIYLSKDLSEPQVYEALINAATQGTGWDRMRNQVAMLCALIRKLAK